MMKQYYGIIATIIYALIIRGLAEYNIIEVNSLSFLLITPAILGFIPFFFRNDKFYSSVWKAIFFPLLSVLFFLLIAVLTRIEDILCFIIIGMPYIFVSVFVSVALYQILKKKKDELSKNMLSILVIPLILGNIEKQFPKTDLKLDISEKVIIHTDVETIYDNLLAIPNLEKSEISGISNYLGVPRPLYSTYDKEKNVRKGYFENDIVLYETVVHSEKNKELVFEIDIDKSELKNSPTLQHVLTLKGIEFKNIRYQLIEIDSTKTELRLSTSFTINSNLNFYGKFWSELIISDFEKNILYSLKYILE